MSFKYDMVWEWKNMTNLVIHSKGTLTSRDLLQGSSLTPNENGQVKDEKLKFEQIELTYSFVNPI